MAEDRGPPFGQEIELRPQAPGSVPTPESLQAEQSLDDVDELVTEFGQLGLQFQGEIDEAAFSGLIGRIQAYLEEEVWGRNTRSMLTTFSYWTSTTESRRGQELRTLEELFQAVARRHRHMQIVYLQGLLYTARMQDLGERVQAMVEETAAAGTMRIPYIIFGPPQSSHRDLPHYMGVIQIYMKSTFEHIDLNLQKLLRELSAFLGLPVRLVKVRSINTGNSFWITVLVPLSAMEMLRQKFYEPDIKEYLASIGISKIKFLQSQKTDQGRKGKGRKRERTPEPTTVKMEPKPETSTETKYERISLTETDQGRKGKGRKRQRTPEPTTVKMEPKPGTSTETKYKRIETEPEVEAKEKLMWKSLESSDILHYFSDEGFEQLGRVLQENTTSGKEMVKWNPDFLMKIGIKESELDIVKMVMKKQNKFESSLITKVMSDPVHKHMEFHPLCVKIIHTPEFQRLRNIKQLGSVYMVYPGATHNRFEHSLGVGHLAQTFAQSLQQRQPELGITDEDVLCVTIAGLCHDLGHGPHSHLFEYFMKEARPDLDWQHEDASVMMFDHLVEKNNLKTAFRWYGLGDEKYLDFIRVQIKGKNITEEDRAWVGDMSFLFEIVTNRRNGIDVDKWDSIARDCLMLGIPNSFDHIRIMKHARVIKIMASLHICFRDEEKEDLYKMFQTIHSLNRQAYQHETQQAIEVMRVDALMLAEKSGEISFEGHKRKRLSISECVQDPVAFTSLDDSVFSLIQLSPSDNKDIMKAKELLIRIQNTMFYKLVGESEPTGGKIHGTHTRELIADPLSPDQVAVKMMKLDYGTEDENPFEATHFYDEADPFTAITIKRQQVSLVLPDIFCEHVIRLYCKVEDENTIANARRHFATWLHRYGIHLRTPFLFR